MGTIFNKRCQQLGNIASLCHSVESGCNQTVQSGLTADQGQPASSLPHPLDTGKHSICHLRSNFIQIMIL